VITYSPTFLLKFDAYRSLNGGSQFIPALGWSLRAISAVSIQLQNASRLSELGYSRRLWQQRLFSLENVTKC
jgi:hypothetical protein